MKQNFEYRHVLTNLTECIFPSLCFDAMRRVDPPYASKNTVSTILWRAAQLDNWMCAPTMNPDFTARMQHWLYLWASLHNNTQSYWHHLHPRYIIKTIPDITQSCMLWRFIRIMSQMILWNSESLTRTGSMWFLSLLYWKNVSFWFQCVKLHTFRLSDTNP